MRFLHCLLVALALEGTALAVMFFFLWSIPFSVQVDSPVTFQAPLPMEVADSEDWEEIEPDVPAETILEEPVVLEELWAAGGSGYDESDFSEGPFHSRYENTAIGLGGGAGGGRRGRGGRRSLRAGGGSGLTHRTWKRSNLPTHLSKLEVGAGDALPLQRMQATVRVDGFRARVVLDCFYRNDRDRRLEGTFKLRMPDGASPFFFAFGETIRQAPALQKTKTWDSFEPEAILSGRDGTWKAPIVARMVPREKAAQAYEQTVRRRVDPALLEWGGAGVFHARVFPLQPGRLHRIVLAYDVDVTKIGNDLEYRLEFPREIETLDVDLRVNGDRRRRGWGLRPDVSVAPAVEPTAGHYAYRDTDARLFVVRYADPGPLLLRGADSTGPYFATRFEPDLARARTTNRPHAIFLLDVSASSKPDKFAVWVELLRGILERNEGSLETFKVLLFDIERRWWRAGWTANVAENRGRLLDDLDDLTLEGATDLAGALSAVAGEQANLFLLSDGAATWGASRLPDLKGTLFAYRTGLPGSDSETLEGLARRSNGALFSVAGPGEIRAASTAHCNRPWRILSVTVEGGSDLLIRGRPGSIFPGQTLTVAGRGRPRGGALLTLTLEQDGRTQEIEHKLGRDLESPLATRVYGQIAVGQLEDLGEAGLGSAKAYATHFRVPGRSCSLLMLESDADYDRLGIRVERSTFLIKADPVGAILSRIAEVPRKPKSELRAWLERQSKSSAGPRLSVPLRLLLDRMPAGELDISPQENAAGLRLASTRVEENPGDPAVARGLGYEALRLDRPGHAYHLFRRVAAVRPSEPQTYLALAECGEALRRPALALLHYEMALGGRWALNQAPFTVVARKLYVGYLTRLLRDAKEFPEFARARLETLAGTLSTPSSDLVVTLTWNTDRTDIDLHITDPDGEECFYKHTRTKMGGSLTKDITDGYGPEMFTLAHARPGEYLFRVHYYDGDRNRTNTPTRVYVTVFRRWGTRRETIARSTVVLAKVKQMQEIARIVIGPPGEG